MAEYCRARQVLAQADRGIYLDGVLSSQEFTSGRYRRTHPTSFAVQQWVQTLLQGSDVATSSVIVSVKDLPAPRTRPKPQQLKTPDAFSVDIECCATRLGRGAGGRPATDTQDNPEVRKKGPARWNVAATVMAVYR